MNLVDEIREPDSTRRAIEAAYRQDETAAIEALLPAATFEAEALGRIAESAGRLVAHVRQERLGSGGLDAFLHEYQLSTREGVILMCLAEALLRIPDAETANRLIRDKFSEADWEAHLGHSDSVFVNASTWALMLTGRVVKLEEGSTGDPRSALRQLVAKSGEPIIRQAMTQAMRIMARQFVMGRTIEDALERARQAEDLGYRHSYDMLGEAAHTKDDAERYFAAYGQAIDAIGGAGGGRGAIEAPGISVKLSALHPRYEFAQRRRAVPELAARLGSLAAQAREAGIGICVDAEEAERLELSLDIVAEVIGDARLAGWEGFGVAVQAYLKCASQVVDWLAALARDKGQRLMVRLVKGAYWDSEIKLSQERGLVSYPVFTRKASTDVSYLACARKMLAARDAFYCQFATHNAHTLAAVLEMAGDDREFEFQRIHGMGEALYDQVVGAGGATDATDATDATGAGVPCRVYAPVGSHEDLLPYLVRRLLENGANTSFVNRIVDEELPVEAIIADPTAKVAALAVKPHPRIPLPGDLYGAARRNSSGLDLASPAAVRDLAGAMEAAAGPWTAAPVVDGGARAGRERPLLDPADHRRRVGTVAEATAETVAEALAAAASAAPEWAATPLEERAGCLERAADLMEEERAELMALAVREAGKTIADALAEVREAVDFCRYYAARGRTDFARSEDLPGPTGESNQVAMHGRGVFAAISPWNFPLAIFTGQVTAALVAGNAVVAKPAEQTPLMAARAVDILHRAGVPGGVLHLLPGDGPGVGAPLVADGRVAGVVFTGSVETAHLINRALAARPGAIAPLIAETGGQNAMIVDSTALAEQVVSDAVSSALGSAGQRCSALRVLFLQDEIAARVTDMLAGAMAELVVGDPGLLATDVGPVIDAEALAPLEDHARRMEREGRLIYRTALSETCAHGTFFAPRAFEIDRMDLLEGEVFGPILHVISYAADRLDEVIEAVNVVGYGLTLGIHSRVDATVRYIQRRLRVGNTYVNRNMIGAVVGVQPFGGEGLSGTGPKAGGPRYLHRFATERTMSINTAAAGGNAALMSLGEEETS
ncbi:MAG: bifunctional proline dehydrogenase/L-glutamate gamma-semialdehyde dehydrogenase PutA [Rhodospirillales bacterium]|nr:bifunctional proline dehydrogenase/L-glutamate gamma-semialdehyde dehydrogenase PutA [Rhodospirillales bacterium]MDP6773731.1 bifunctional proline dehydrogenase/L-glutamate gamma-semialdehyde dehydrogenase PutA [Rhodospirillales bacterium]